MAQPRQWVEGPRRGLIRGVGTLMWVFASMASAWASSPLPQVGATAQEALAKAPGPGKSTADHSKFKELQGPFKTGSEVTKACLSCHTEAAK